MMTSAGSDYDGIICIGGVDWWYHNRGHFDLQILRRLAPDCPVLYVNSIGVRVPSLAGGAKFATKVARKLRSWGRGMQQIEPGFWVTSPVAVPGAGNRGVAGKLLAAQIRWQAQHIGMKRPLIWVHCPAGAEFCDALGGVGLLFQRTDRFEAFPEGDADTLQHQVDRLKDAADLVVYCNEGLMAEELADGTVAQAALVSHGVDYERFATAGEAAETADARVGSTPDDMADLARPTVGFIGGIDHHTFDPELFLSVAQSLPDVSFVLVGGCSLPVDWCELANVRQVGRKPYDDVARYMAASDVLIMPWNDSDWIKAATPIKLKEYLAVGRPIVTTDFPALGPFRSLVQVADGAEQFSRAIQSALADPGDPNTRRAAVVNETWDSKARELVAAMEAVGLNFSSSVQAQRGQLTA